MIRIIVVILIIASLFYVGYQWLSHRSKPMPPKTAANVDLKKYAGTWYELARFPNTFEKGCRCVSATYELREDYIEVTNRCIKYGQLKTIVGKAWPVKNSNNSKLKVQFFLAFKGDYWIIYVDKAYQYAIVGVPSRKYLWILGRDKKISPKNFFVLKQIAEQAKFDTTQLINTDQSSCAMIN